MSVIHTVVGDVTITHTPCLICDAPAAGQLCAVHDREWFLSAEWGRARESFEDNFRATMRADFVNRARAELKNGTPA